MRITVTVRVDSRTEKVGGRFKLEAHVVEGDRTAFGNYLVLESADVPGVELWAIGDTLRLTLETMPPVAAVEQTIEDAQRCAFHPV